MSVEVGLRGHTPDKNALRRMFKVEKPETFVRIYIRDGAHKNPYTGEQMSILELASILINGGYNIPPRRIFEDFAREQQSAIYAIMKEACDPKKNGTDFYRFKKEKRLQIAYARIGIQVTLLLRRWLLTGAYYKAAVPNAPFTIARKGSNVPLVDTGAFVEHMDWKVMNG